MTRLTELFVCDKKKRGYVVNYSRIVRSRLHAFELDERFYIKCNCACCGHESFMPSWDIADVLQSQEDIKCTCKEGGLLPVLKEKTNREKAS